MEYPQYQQYTQHPHLQGGYQTSPQSAGPGSLQFPSGPRILSSQTQNYYQPQSAGPIGYTQYGLGAGMTQGYVSAAAMATAAASG
jgi:hypothetical protein